MKKKLLMLSVLLAVLMSVPALAAEDEYEEAPPVVLTYNEALALAFENLPAVQDLENRIAEMEEELSDLNDEYRLISWLGNREVNNALRRQITELNRQIEHMNLEIEIIKLRREQALISSLVVISNASLDIETAEASIVITAEQVRRTGRLRSFGLASANDLRIVQARLTQEQTDLDSLLIARADGIISLNHLLGQPVYQQTYVEFERQLPDIPANLTSYIDALIRQAPSIRQMRFDIYRRREELTRHRDFYREREISPRRDCETCLALRNAYDLILLENDVALRAMGTALRAAFSSLEQLQNQESVARLNLSQAEEALQTAQTNFELGIVTQFEIDQAMFSIFSARQAIERILNLQWGLALSLANPVLL